MSTSLNDLAVKLKKSVRFQEMPIQMVDEDYDGFIANGANRLYIDFGYNNWIEEYDPYMMELSRTLSTSEEEYVLAASEIAFYNEIKKNWATIVGYSTNAITITFPHKPWEHIDKMINDLENRLSVLFYKISKVGGGG